jgi:ADP-ribosylglycohydrolase
VGHTAGSGVTDTGIRRASGALFGLAYGDAMGAPTEFLSMAEIERRYGPDGPRDIGTGRVTDDTQMTLSVAGALLAGAAEPPRTAARLEPALRERFLQWAVSPENDRAPGNTCLAACAVLAEGLPWQDATIVGSKGCGANMRVAPVGLVPGWSDDERAGAAQLQAALTHGHPTALAASELTAFAVWWLCTGAVAPADLPAALRQRAHAERSTYRADWLGELWRRANDRDPESFIRRGWDECLAALDRLDAALAAPDPHGDPCRVTGEAWIAEEALATSLYCFLLFPDDPVAAIVRGAASSGDSDSIACLAGAYAGAAHGMDAWPADWQERIEYADELRRYASIWDGHPDDQVRREAP